ncbi:urotensin-2 receptor 2 isoform X3 [Leucoraja erinacea]|uniref:urotensin-2 receptor 2 isoform X3 n=1 Tax=Leucoraja erinaceus TaxID=7782 RepID=UPI002454BF02|nr:urotensin-2 receptor 2 isoform X3 [Leucoraja erinacea]
MEKVNRERENVDAKGGLGQEHESMIKNKSKRATWQKWFTVAVSVTLSVVSTVVLWDYLQEDDFKEVFARQTDILEGKFFEVPCSKDYESYKRFAGCTPTKCGRAVQDTVVNREVALKMLRIAKRGLSLGGSDGGASILDLHSGALSMGKQFVNIYRYFGDQINDLFDEEDFALYSNVRWRIQKEIAEAFGIDITRLHLTKPTFFSRMNNTEAKTMHDEYWHPHIDKVEFRSSHLAPKIFTMWKRYHGAHGTPLQCPSHVILSMPFKTLRYHELVDSLNS